MSVATRSVKRGEAPIDTAMTLNAIYPDALALLSVFRHRANIERLIKREEPKVGGGEGKCG